MIRNSVFILFLLALTSSAAKPQETAPSFGFLPEPQQAQAAAAREDELFSNADDYRDEEKWAEAAEAYSKAAAVRGRRADEALYWKSYTLSKVGRRNDALATIIELRKSYPRSKWINDAGALELEIRSAAGQQVNPDAQSDEDLKLIAINSLMNSDEARAIPMLQKFLESNNSPRLKDRALFVLAQRESPQAQQVLASVARGQAHPELQFKAIQYLGIEDSPNTRQLLEQIYKSSSDTRIKRAVLQAFITCDAKQNTLTVIREERDPDLRRQAIHNLGAMDGTAELRQLFQASNVLADKEQILEALSIAGDVNTLAEVARTPGNSQLRRKAIHGLGIAGGERARAALVAAYAGDSDQDARRAAAEALFIADDAHDLVQLARKETNPQMRRYLVEKLSLMDSKEAQEYMLELLNK